MVVIKLDTDTQSGEDWEECEFQNPSRATQQRETDTTSARPSVKEVRSHTLVDNGNPSGVKVNHKSSHQEVQSGDKRKRAHDEIPDARDSSKQQKRDHVAELHTANDASKPTAVAKATRTPERMLDNSPVPTRRQHTAKGPKVKSKSKGRTHQSRFDTQGERNNGKRAGHQGDTIEEKMPEPSSWTEPRQRDSGGTLEGSHRAQRLLEEFVHETGLDPTYPGTATKVVREPYPGEDRVLTVTWGDRGAITLHDTAIQRQHKVRNSSSIRKPSTPYLKKGRHGPQGDFDTDPDRESGIGHDYEPEDLIKLNDYSKTQREFKQKYPGYPKVQFKDDEGLELLKIRRQDELWYLGYARKYPGHTIDQWPCGCRKLSNKVGSESESEEG